MTFPYTKYLRTKDQPETTRKPNRRSQIRLCQSMVTVFQKRQMGIEAWGIVCQFECKVTNSIDNENRKRKNEASGH